MRLVRQRRFPASSWPPPTLPGGRHAERRRIQAAAARVVSERGYLAISVAEVASEAGLSTDDFFGHFVDLQHCVLNAYDEAFDDLSGAIELACAQASDWPDKVAAAIHASVDLATESPDHARLLLLDTVGCDPELAARVSASNEWLAALMRGGRRIWPGAKELPELLDKALVGAATYVIGHHLRHDRLELLSGATPPLVELTLLPYVGREAARAAALADRGSLV